MSYQDTPNENGFSDFEEPSSPGDIVYDSQCVDIPQMEEEVVTSLPEEVVTSLPEEIITSLPEEIVTSLPEEEVVLEDLLLNNDIDSEIDVMTEDSADKSKDEESLLNDSKSPSKLIQDYIDDGYDTEKNTTGTRLPLARVKKIMKSDPYLGLASQDSIFLIAKATELFIESLAIEAYQITAAAKKKTVTKKDMETIIDKIDALAFLDGALD